MATRLDPDSLARLDDERAFLLASLSDLEAEHAAGDLSEADYEALRDDYTRRTAEVLRAIDEERAAFTDAPRIGGRQVAIWVAGLALVGLVAGVAVARSSGSRLAGETGSGDVRLSAVSQLNQARQLLGEPDEWDTAIDIYGQVLDQQPSNAEARTYRAWLEYRQGAPVDDVLDDWDAALRQDAGYPDARVFRAIALADAGRWVESGAELDAFDALDPPAALANLVDSQGLRAELARADADRLRPELGRPGPVELAELDISALRALGAANVLLGSDGDGSVLGALKLYDAVLAAQPDNPEALLGKALVLFRAGLVDEADALLGRFEALPPEIVPEILQTDARRLRLALDES